MRKNPGLLVATLLLFTIAAYTQNVKLTTERKEDGAIIFASNPDPYPNSVEIKFDMTNMNFSEGTKNLFVIPARTEKVKIGELTMAERKAYKYGYSYRTAMGDLSKMQYDKDYVYNLPFAKGKSFLLFQGYNGNFSHQNENAVDFTMPVGTEVCAAREGTVVQLVQGNSISCPKQECQQYNNYITIMHSDGTFGQYTHIQTNSSKLKVGDVVKKGDVIALSGNVGWSSGPHLHFVVFQGSFDKWKTLETKFRVEDGSKSIVLKEGISYTRNY